MSWSISAEGKAPAVAVKVARDFAGFIERLAQPERNIAEAAFDAIRSALADYPPNGVVTINASGSQSGEGAARVNQLRVEITPRYSRISAL